MTFTAADHTYEIAAIQMSGFWPRVINVVTRSKWDHEFVILDDCIVEANAGGVRKLPLDYYDGCTVIPSQYALNPDEQAKLKAFTLSQVGKPYDYLDDFAIGMYDLTNPVTGNWLWKLIEKSLEEDGHWECAALADAAMTAAGIKVFDDGRPTHAVSPSDLANLFLAKGWNIA